MGTTRCRSARSRAVVASGTMLGLGLVLIPSMSEAIPAFARQLNAKCTTCHTPVPPRLNNVGIAFKRMGFRMPDADDEGRLVLKDKPGRGVFDDFSLIGDVRILTRRGEPAAFELHEVESMGAGTLGSRFSYAAEVAWEEGEFELEFAEGQVLLGRAGRNVTARFGLLPPLAWEKFNHQRLTIARPLLVNTRVSAGPFRGFRLRDEQPGFEFGLNFNQLAAEGGNLRATYLSVGVFNGFAQEEGSVLLEENNDFKDVLVQAVQLWGESNTVAALWYRGKVTDVGAEGFEDRVNRWALLANYRLASGTDFVAGFGIGRDDTNAADIGEVKSRGWFAEVNQAIGDKTVVAFRWDRFEPNQDVSARDVSGPTVSATHHVLDNLILTLEYQGLRTGKGERLRDVTGRLTFIY